MIGQLKNFLDQESCRLFLWFPVGMGMGIVAYFALATEPSILLTAGVFVGQVLGLFFLRKTQYLKLLGIATISITLGFLAIHYKTWWLQDVNGVIPLTERLKGEFVGEIQDIEFKQNRKRYILELDDGRLVRLSEKGKQDLAIGDIIRFKSTLLPFSPPVLEDGYDYGRAAFYKGLSATGRMTDVAVLQQASHSSGNFQVVRYYVTQALLSAIPGESGAVAAALVTGERGKIPEATRQAYADAGIAHVLAISGLHLSMIAGLVFMVFRRGLCLSTVLAEHYNLKKIASLMTFPFLVGYLLISGMGVPAIRSFIMVGIVLLGVLVDRKALSMRTLALAAIVILMVQPENLVSASFSLSFAAVMALVASYEGGWSPLRDWANEGGKWRRIMVYGIGIVASTVIATLATIPITLYIFNRISLQAIIGNLVAIPLMGFIIMPLLLIGVLSLLLGQFNKLFVVLDYAIDLMTKVSYWTASLPGAAIQIARPPEAFIWLAVFGGLWLCLWRTRVRLLGLIPCCIAVMLLLVKAEPFVWLSSDAQIYWYDGQRLSTFANARHNDFAEALLLRQLGLKEINVVVDDSARLAIQGVPVVLLNERFSRQHHGDMCKQARIIVSCRYLPIFYEDSADIILDRSDLMPGQGRAIHFGRYGGEFKEVDRRRPWHPNSQKA